MLHQYAIKCHMAQRTNWILHVITTKSQSYLKNEKHYCLYDCSTICLYVVYFHIRFMLIGVLDLGLLT